MKKILRILLGNADKIVLAILLLMLILVLTLQSFSYRRTMALIDSTKKIDTSTKTGKKLLPELDKTVFNAKVEVEPAKTWQPAYTVGKWEQLKPETIFKDHSKPPAVMGRDLRQHLDKFGPSTLFDPPVYVVPIDRKPYLLDFGSLRAFYPPYRVDYVENREDILKGTVDTADDDDDDDDDDTVAVKKVIKPTPLIDMIRWAPPYKTYYPRLPFILSSVIKTKPEKEEWDITVKVNRRAEILKMGDKIPGTDYLIDDVEYEERNVKRGEMVYKEKIFRITVARQDGKGQKIKLQKGVRVTDPNADPMYEVMFFAYGKKTQKVKSGSTLRVKQEDRRGEFLVLVEDNVPLIVEMSRGEQVGQPVTLKKYDEDEYRAWQRREKKRKESRTPSSPKKKRPSGVPGGLPPDVEGFPPGMDM